ncbi:N-acylneuraminate-9-phosphatase-like [Branchiostoma floridae]|uniref:N-acylneuraminate-9-phosphatase-like n=1 Tax=Branchiostoma floridae TaxID=7739 RepID=A0A9J7LJZ3_BRAFL|nr:N-acylneuraminate-9-phosphatase-like [Branchiostoma floridae]
MALNTKKVAAIIFDLDNTLIPTKEADDEAYELVREVIEEACPGYDTAAMTSKFRVDLGWNEGCDPDGRLTVDEWRTQLWESTLNAQGITQYNGLPARMYATWKRERLKRMVFTPEIKKMLVDLRKEYKLQMMTNGPLEPQRRMVFTPEIKKMLVDLRKEYKLQMMTNGPLEPQREKSQVCLFVCLFVCLWLFLGVQAADDD